MSMSLPDRVLESEKQDTGIEETEHQSMEMHEQSTFLNGTLINLNLFLWIP